MKIVLASGSPRRKEQMKKDKIIKQNHEVEVRILLEDVSKEEIFERLANKGFVHSAVEDLTDAYFCKKSVKSFSEVEMDEVGSYSLRLRKRTIKNRESVELNIKAITKERDHSAWDEYEVEIGSFDEMKQILEVIGYKNFFDLIKTRYVFKKDNLTMLVEDIEGLGLALEAEIITDKDSAEASLDKIYSTISSLGFDPSKKVHKSITNLLMKKQSKF
jgi:predicted adenylyl cyclase CyaB